MWTAGAEHGCDYQGVRLTAPLRYAIGLLPDVIPLSASQAALLDSWRASDLAVLDDGDAVDSWSSVNHRTLTGSSTQLPRLYHNVTASGGPVVRFSQDWLRNDNASYCGSFAGCAAPGVLLRPQPCHSHGSLLPYAGSPNATCSAECHYAN
jgi:hypothetical protein